MPDCKVQSRPLLCVSSLTAPQLFGTVTPHVQKTFGPGLKLAIAAADPLRGTVGYCVATCEFAVRLLS